MREDALSGRVVVITGASSGIGLAVARELHRCGAHLVLTARRAERLASAAAELSAHPVAGDLATPGMPAELLRAALSRFGRCDVVVNNAGIIEVGPIESIARCVRFALCQPAHVRIPRLMVLPGEHVI